MSKRGLLTDRTRFYLVGNPVLPGTALRRWFFASVSPMLAIRTNEQLRNYRVPMTISFTPGYADRFAAADKNFLLAEVFHPGDRVIGNPEVPGITDLPEEIFTVATTEIGPGGPKYTLKEESGEFRHHHLADARRPQFFFGVVIATESGTFFVPCSDAEETIRPINEPLPLDRELGRSAEHTAGGDDAALLHGTMGGMEIVETGAELFALSRVEWSVPAPENLLETATDCVENLEPAVPAQAMG